MRFLCDVHISYRIKRFLQSQGHECNHVNEILDGDKTTDYIIADHCNKHDIILITKDEDFADSYLLKRLPSKLLKISLGNISTTELIKLIEAALPLLESMNVRHHFMVEIHKNNIQISDDYNL